MTSREGKAVATVELIQFYCELVSYLKASVHDSIVQTRLRMYIDNESDSEELRLTSEFC